MADTPVATPHLLALLRSMPEAVVVVDRQGTIAYWNAGAVRIFGYDADQAIGQSLDLIIPERQRPRHWEGFRRAVATGQSRYGQSDLLSVPALTADGRRISIEFTVTLLADGDTVDLVGAVIRDVTERWAEERRLRQRVQELEQDG